MMNKALTFLAAMMTTACVTINIYFPAAAAEKVADQIIQEIQQEQTAPDATSPQSTLPPWQIYLFQGLDTALNYLIRPAHAGADLSVDTPEIRRIQAVMQSRFSDIKPYYDNGTIGIDRNGMLTVKGSVALKDRNRVNKLIAAENTDRNRLYQAIANANGQPGWFNQIKDTFAARWVENAHRGWWYQSADGSWKQK